MVDHPQGRHEAVKDFEEHLVETGTPPDIAHERGMFRGLDIETEDPTEERLAIIVNEEEEN